MQRYLNLLFAIILFFPQASNAQNWKTVAINDTTYFRSGKFYQDSNYLRVIWLDSARQINNDSVFYFLHTIRDTTSNSSQNSQCLDTIASSWLGEKCIRKANGIEYYFNSFHDTITIKTNAGIGENWILAKDTAGVLFQGTIIQTSLQFIDGVLDSVKTIHIQALQNGNPVANWYNGLVLQFSKKHGWIQTLDLYSFPNKLKMPFFWGCITDSNQHYRLPKAFNNTEINKIDLQWKYTPGNEWIWQEEHDCNPNYNMLCKTYIHDSIVGFVSLSSNKALVSFKTDKYKIDWELVQPANTPVGYAWVPNETRLSYYHTDTITADTSLIVSKSLYPECKQKLAIADHYFIDSFCNRYIIKYRTNSYGPYRIDINICWSVVLAYYADSKDVLAGFGTLISEDASYYGDYNKSYYSYLKLGGCTTGTKINVRSLGVEDLKAKETGISIYPNPAKDYVTVTLPHAPVNEKIVVSLYDISGRVIISQQCNEASTTLNIAHLSSGVYFIKINGDGTSHTDKLIIE